MKASQADKILHFMRMNDGITTMDAIKLIGCTRLAARISDLRKRGYTISTKTVKVKNRNGEETYVAKYSISGEGRD